MFWPSDALKVCIYMGELAGNECDSWWNLFACYFEEELDAVTVEITLLLTQKIEPLTSWENTLS